MDKILTNQAVRGNQCKYSDKSSYYEKKILIDPLLEKIKLKIPANENFMEKILTN